MLRADSLPRRFLRPTLALCFLLAPAGVVSLSLAVSTGGTLLNSVPVWSDELHYWNEVACFQRAGFRGGYCVVDERTAPAAWSHFGPHGPGFPVVYGGLARVFGWRPASAPLFHTVLLALASAAWLACCRPDTPRLAAATLLSATFWPCLLYLPATMQEGLHCAIAFVLAGLAHPRVNRDDGLAGLAHPRVNRDDGGAWSLGPFLAVAAAASLIRVTWVLVLIPWACVALRRTPWRWRIALVAGVAVSVPALIAAWRLVCSPYPSFLADLFATARASPSEAVSALAERAGKSLRMFFDRDAGATLEVLLRYQAIVVVVLGLGMALEPRSRGRRALLFAGLNVGLVAAAVIGFYDVASWRDFRVLAPHLLLSLLVLLSGEAFRWAAVLVVSQLLFAPAFLTQFETNYADRFDADKAAVANVRSRVEGMLQYDPADPAWGNTVLVPESLLQYPLLGLPRGVGISLYSDRSTSLALPPKSRYLLLGPSHVRALGNRVRLRPLKEVSPGTLYLNLDYLPDGG
jgi:hypothetical protein